MGTPPGCRARARAVWLLAALLGAAVVLVTGNTIRLAILNRREEIEILKLVGAPDAFVRRPFLYSGLLQGLAGGLVALALVLSARAALAGPVAALAALYAADFRVAALGAGRALALLGAGGALGLAGAWLAVGRHLREIAPR
jgi:cell division transport system permease protein